MPETLAHDIITPRSPRVTVFIPAYNAERYIGEAIESILAQTFTDFELLLIDDASTDRTPAVIADFADDARLRLVAHAENMGRPRTRNQALDIARGEYIAFLDADDYCMPERLARQVAYLDAHPHIDGVGSWKAWVDSAGQASQLGVRRFPIRHAEIACQMLTDCAMGQTSMMMRRRAFEGYRYDNDFLVSQDYELWARMIRTRRFANMPQTLTSYRQHTGQSIHRRSRDQQELDLAVYAHQVRHLGVTCDRRDLVRHERFFKFAGRESVFERTGAPLDIEYVRWARRWLDALRIGNARVRAYPEPIFSDMLTARWLHACRKAIRNSSLLEIVRELGRCPLTYRMLFHPLAVYRNRKNNQLS